MKKKFNLLFLFLALLVISCSTTKETNTTPNISEVKETFYPLTFEDVKKRNWSADFIMAIQFYASQSFQLNSTGRREGDLVESGVVVFDKEADVKSVNFKSKIEGRVIEISPDKKFLLVQFHDDIGPALWFGSNGGEYFLVNNSKDKKSIVSNGIFYNTNNYNVFLEFKAKQRIKLTEASFDASGLKVGEVGEVGGFEKNSTSSSTSKEPADKNQEKSQQNRPTIGKAPKGR